MTPTGSPEPRGLVARCLVVGSYPPVPGPAAAATLAAVRRAWAAGREVVVVSPRPSAAPFVMHAAGPRGIAREMARLGRRHGCDGVVLCAEPGWPLRGRTGTGVRSLATALSSFAHAELVVTGDIGPHGGLLAPLWGVVESVTAGSEAVATALRAAGASVVHVHDPYDGAGIAPQAFPPGAVPPLEHGELLLRVRARRFVGALARKVLGRRAPAVRSYLYRRVAWAQRARQRGPAT